MLLILGQPGIGKSTLITWITANFRAKISDIFIYRFASDLENVDWESSKISKEILNKLELEYNDLNGKVLILDGLDEVSMYSRRIVLNNLYDNLINGNYIKNFSLIITCRENYIQEMDRIKSKYIILQPWNETQIRSFCNIFEEKVNSIISENTIKKIVENRDILGIPLILYMVLALNISVEKEGSIVDIYDKIFCLDGGIYDRCIDNRYFADKHRISEIKEQIHQVSREIAIWMFENNSEEANIPKREYLKICSNVIKKQEIKNKDIQNDFLIGNFFKLVRHCEGIESEELYFVHRSIYEYFVAETIYCSIEGSLMRLDDKSKEEFASNIAPLLQIGKISYTIGEYLKHKIVKLFINLEGEQKKNFYQWIEKTVENMMDFGMFYYCKKTYKNIIEKEINCFLNLLEILRYLLNINGGEFILFYIKKELILKYITYSVMFYSINKINFSSLKINLKNVYLKGTDLTRIDLRGIDLSEANLTDAKLVEVNLTKTIIQGVDLRGADLRRANLGNISLQGTKLNKSIWEEQDVKKIHQQLCDAVFNYIVVKNCYKKRKIYKEDLFPNC